jgi:hypothetical protein
MQARRKKSKVNWDLIKFNRILVDSLIMHDPSKTPPSTSNQSTINNASTATEAVQALRRKNNVIQREIKPQRTNKGVLLGMPKKVEEVTDVQLIEQAHSHTLVRVGRNKRRECWGCQIRSRLPRPKEKMLIGGRPPLQDITNKAKKGESHWAKKVTAKCLQCDVPLCVHGECWDIYHRSKKFR